MSATPPLGSPSGSAWITGLALLGHLVLRIYDPRRRDGRLAFLRGLFVWALLGGCAYALIDPIADAEWISDRALCAIASVYAALSGFWMAALLALCARRAHDLGLSGAWALIVAAPGANAFFLLLALALPGRAVARDLWPESGRD